MGAIKTFTLSTHSRLFSVPDSNREYLFVEAGKYPYYAEPYRAESYAIVFIKEGGVRLNTGLSSMDVDAPAMITLGPSVIRFFTKRSDQLKMDANFRQLLRRHYMQEHKLDFYASQLHLTPKSLSAAIKKQTGRSAGKWIDDAVILEAKVLLQNNALTVSQVSSMLNFSDQSVFGKFFRANAGMSPVEYRQRFL